MDLNNLNAFIAVIDQQTLTRAAEKLGMPKSTLSRHISNLENELGLKLLVRQGRLLQATEAGERLYHDTAELLDAINSASYDLSDDYRSARGLIRIQSPVEFMTHEMAQLLIDFQKQYPDILICFTQYAGDPDLENHCDITIVAHDRPLPDSNKIARPLMSISQGLYSSSHLNTGPDPLTLDNMAGQPLILESQETEWHFRRGNQLFSIPVSSPLMMNSPSMRILAAQRGLGIIRLPGFMAEKPLRQGSLKEVTTEFPLWALGVTLVYSHRQPPAKISAFVDFMQTQFARLHSQI